MATLHYHIIMLVAIVASMTNAQTSNTQTSNTQTSKAVPASPWQNIGQSANVDWSRGIVQVRGAGFFPTGLSEAESKLQAIGAARADALRLLALVSAQIPVDSWHDVASYELKLEQFVQFATFAEPVFSRYQGRQVAYVDAKMPLFGAASLTETVLLKEQRGSPVPARADQASAESFTGVIIDASALSVRPSLSSMLLDDTDRVVYSLQNLQSVARGMQRYYDSVAAAREHPQQVGDNPLVIQALSIEGTTLRISSSDATRLLQADKNQAFLAQGSVAIVANP